MGCKLREMRHGIREEMNNQSRAGASDGFIVVVQRLVAVAGHGGGGARRRTEHVSPIWTRNEGTLQFAAQRAVESLVLGAALDSRRLNIRSGASVLW